MTLTDIQADAFLQALQRPQMVYRFACAQISRPGADLRARNALEEIKRLIAEPVRQVRALREVESQLQEARARLHDPSVTHAQAFRAEQDIEYWLGQRDILRGRVDTLGT